MIRSLEADRNVDYAELVIRLPEAIHLRLYPLLTAKINYQYLLPARGYHQMGTINVQHAPS
jgi:hypothetical protein